MNNSSKHLEQNVHGWERAVSPAGGLYFLAKGLRRGASAACCNWASAGWPLPGA